MARSRLPILVRILLGLFVFVLLCLAVVYGQGRIGTAKWQRYAADLRSAGQPLTFAEIEALRAVVPDDRNSARALEPLIPRIKTIDSRQVNEWVLVFGRRAGGFDFFNGIPRYALAPSRQFLDEHRDIVTGLTSLADGPTGRFDIRYEPMPFNTLLPHLTSLRAASKLLLLDAVLELTEGAMEPAGRNAEIVWSLSGTLDDEPTIISRLVQMAIQDVGVQILEIMLRVGELENDLLARLADALDRKRTSATMRWALWGERANWIETLEQLARGHVALASLSATQTPNMPPTGSPSMMPNMLIRGEQLLGTQMLSRLIDAGDDPAALLVAAEQFDTEVKLRLSRWHVLFRILMPSLSRPVVLHIRSTARLDCARAALAAEQFRLARGRLPDTLVELVPDFLSSMPVDPFSGGPLRLAVTEMGVVIYSVGEDHADNGGDVARLPKQKQPQDVGFRLPAAEHRGILLTSEPEPKDEE